MCVCVCVCVCRYVFAKRITLIFTIQFILLLLGASGDFHVEFQWIGATIVPGLAEPPVINDNNNNNNISNGGHNLTCKVQRSLRFNVSGRAAADYMPLPALPLEGLAEAVCCDTLYAQYSEPRWFFNRTDVDLYGAMAQAGGSPTTFYDAACGLPVYVAPRNRTMAEFMADTNEHGWPSFRPPEIVEENIVIVDGGDVYSKCGTHLGSYLPDDQGPRHCIDLVCVSGNPAKAAM